MKAIVLGLILLLPAGLPIAAAVPLAEGFIRLDGLRLDVRHAVAVRADGDHPEAPGEVQVYLSDFPLDAAALHDSGYPEGAARDAADAAGGGFVSICIAPDGSECQVYLYHHDPPAHLRTGARGEFTLSRQEPARVAGRWRLASESVMDETLEFDLRFDTPVHPAR